MTSVACDVMINNSSSICVLLPFCWNNSQKL